MRARRLEDHIRQLCAHAVIAQEPELSIVLLEFQSALRTHTERLRAKALERLVNGEMKERRSDANSNASLGHRRVTQLYS
jgi:hypothetical protein